MCPWAPATHTHCVCTAEQEHTFPQARVPSRSLLIKTGCQYSFFRVSWSHSDSASPRAVSIWLWNKRDVYYSLCSWSLSMLSGWARTLAVAAVPGLSSRLHNFSNPVTSRSSLVQPWTTVLILSAMVYVWSVLQGSHVGNLVPSVASWGVMGSLRSRGEK